MSRYASLNDFAAVSPRADGCACASSAFDGLLVSAVPSPSSRSLRSWRVSDWSAVSTSSSCTGAAVRVTGITPPSSSSGAPGVPGRRSTKKLPSRKMRGRIFAVASSCSGSACLLSWSVTTEAEAPSAAGSIFPTFPTLTPAMRTGEPGRIEFADSNVAFTWNGVVNGMSFVNPRKVTMRMITSVIRPIVTGLRCTWRTVFERAITGCPPSSPTACPGVLPITV